MIPNIYEKFIFESFDFDEKLKCLSFNYSLDGKLKFQETVLFDFEITKNYDEQDFTKACFLSFIMSGISYYKLYLPRNIVFSKNIKQRLSQKSANFFNNIYFQGLGEFFMQNNIKLEDIDIQFPVTDSQEKEEQEIFENHKNKATEVDLASLSATDVLVAIGGGKDSLTTVSLLQKHKVPFTTWVVNPEVALNPQLEQISAENEGHKESYISITRQISPNLIDENKKSEALNGHVPISSIWAFLSICSGILKGSKYIVLSNENSANEATCQYQGHAINHQYSKSLDFEKDFQALIARYITTDIKYFSLLRSFTELKIAEIFAENCWELYKDKFSSCNKNFKIIKEDEPEKFTWCGKCPKCAFVFLILAPFIKKESLINIFGRNCFDEDALSKFYYELLGFSDKKPFECVGEIAEVRRAFLMVADERSAFADDVYQFVEELSDEDLVEAAQYNYRVKHPDLVPDVFRKLIN